MISPELRGVSDGSLAREFQNNHLAVLKDFGKRSVAIHRQVADSNLKIISSFMLPLTVHVLCLISKSLLEPAV